MIPFTLYTVLPLYLRSLDDIVVVAITRLLTRSFTLLRSPPFGLVHSVPCGSFVRVVGWLRCTFTRYVPVTVRVCDLVPRSFVIHRSITFPVGCVTLLLRSVHVPLLARTCTPSSRLRLRLCRCWLLLPHAFPFLLLRCSYRIALLPRLIVCG